jgi:hypothetical protein
LEKKILAPAGIWNSISSKTTNGVLLMKAKKLSD